MIRKGDKIILENDLVRLEKLSSEHLGSLVPISNDEPELLQYSPSPFGSKKKLQEYFNIAEKDMETETRYAFAIYDKRLKAWAGSTSYGNISSKNARLEIGWTWIGKRFQRTGLNRNCKYLLLSYAFEKLNCERVELKTDSRNKQSWNAIEGIGAKYEGTLRSHTLMNDGHRRDTAYFSILKGEWPQVKKGIFDIF